MYYKNGSFFLHYEKIGEGDNTILMLPGWGNTRPTFKYLINNLSLNNTVYIIDIPGFGDSQVLEENLTIFDYASLIREFMLQEKIENPIIIAHSFGGRIATLLSGYYQDSIKKLILIDAAGIKPKSTIKSIIHKYSYKLFKKMGFLLPLNLRFKYHKFLFRKYSSSDYYSLPNNMKKTFQNIINTDLKKYIKRIKTPTLILWGQKDKATPLSDAFYFHKKIDKSELIVFRGASHFSYLEYPRAIYDIINIFINEKSVN